MELTTTSLLEILPQAAITVSGDGRIVNCNQQALDLLGSPGFEFIRTINVLRFPALVKSGLSEMVRLALHEKKSVQAEKTFQSSWGKELILKFTCTPIPGIESPEDECLFIFLQDLTEERNLTMELTAANKSKTQFLANMSHEVRTPLNGVIGFLSLLERHVQDSEAREFVDAAKSSAKSLLRLINEVLDVAKIEAGTLVVDKKPFHVRPLVDSVLEQVKPLLNEHPISLNVHVPNDLRQLQGDSIRYTQVLMNLVSNAIKFSLQGSVTIKASIIGARGQESLLTEVLDTGVGIALEHQQAIFQPFVQMDGSHTRRRDGAGLGLSISKSLIQLMQGQMGLESKQNEGSRFWFTVPVNPVLREGDSALSRVYRA
jgi:signal transduction histidine kinase